MAYEYGDTLTVEEYMRLRDAVHWDVIPRDQSENGLRHTQLISVCRDHGEAIGCARMVWDGGYVAYLADVMVVPEAQGRGIGKALVLRLLDGLRAQLKPGWIIKVALFSAKGKEPFYQKIGFRQRPDALSGAGMDLWLRLPETEA